MKHLSGVMSHGASPLLESAGSLLRKAPPDHLGTAMVKRNLNPVEAESEYLSIIDYIETLVCKTTALY